MSSNNTGGRTLIMRKHITLRMRLIEMARLIMLTATWQMSLTNKLHI
jgi:hypothetical protein